MLQNVHRKPCSIQIFRSHCTLCSYCGDISIQGEFFPKSKKLCNVHVWLFIARVYGYIYHSVAPDDSTRNHFFKSLSGRKC